MGVTAAGFQNTVVRQFLDGCLEWSFRTDATVSQKL